MSARQRKDILFRLYLVTVVWGMGEVVNAAESGLSWIVVSEDGTGFVKSGSGHRFVVWGVNYDHDESGRLIEDYWVDEWAKIVEDFQEIKNLNANVVRIHLQLGRFMVSPSEPNRHSLKQLKKLVELAEQNELYLDLTGLGCYHKSDVPDWYDSLSESARWNVQARFWTEVAKVGSQSPAIFCYDLMNEPILPGKKSESEWLAGEFGGKHFVQRISLGLDERTRTEVAAKWVKHLTDAIRSVDRRHMITVGVIPWAMTFKNGKPLFYSPEVGGPLDFVSVHFYPQKDQVDSAIAALKTFELGKPIVIEEIFPLKASIEQTTEFIDRSKRGDRRVDFVLLGKKPSKNMNPRTDLSLRSW